MTSLIQPMDQSVIATFKKHYRKILLQDYLANYTENIQKFLKTMTIKMAIDIMALAWDAVKESTLKGSFSKLLINCEGEKSSDIETENVVLGDEFQTEENIGWFEADLHEDPFDEEFTAKQIQDFIIEHGPQVEEAVDLVYGEDDEDEEVEKMPHWRGMELLSELELYIKQQATAEKHDFLWLKKWSLHALRSHNGRMQQPKIDQYYCNKALPE